MITGASRRIGRAAALGLARQGADIAVTARSAAGEISAVADEVRALGSECVAVMGDVTREEDVRRMVAAAIEELGEIDILINNAAIRQACPMLEMSLSDWHAVCSVILDGAFLMCREVIPSMIRQGGGTVVNIGGVSGHIGGSERAHVSAAKAGLVGLTKSVAVEFADRGITANCVVPGKIGGKRSATSGESPNLRMPILVGREGDISEAAGVIVSMCLPHSRFMTGQTVHVSGGLYMP